MECIKCGFDMIAFVKKNKGVKLFCPKCGIENWTWKTNIEVAKQDLIERKYVSESYVNGLIFMDDIEKGDYQCQKNVI